jgi:hypothetical protein
MIHPNPNVRHISFSRSLSGNISAGYDVIDLGDIISFRYDAS